VFLTLRLLQVSDCGHYSDHPPTSLVPKAPLILTPATTCLEYVLADTSVNASEKSVFSGLELKLGRWDARRMYKVFDFAVVGEKFAELSERINVTLATQSSIEKIFSLVQGALEFSIIAKTFPL
jgi:beta-1,4-glucuronyltransferase 1